MATQTKTVEVIGNATGNTSGFAAKRTGATGTATSVTVAEVAGTGAYTISINWDDASAANEPLGDWLISVGSAVGSVGRSAVTFTADVDSYTVQPNTITVVPLTGVVESRADGTTITVFTSETLVVSVACVDADGDAVDISAMTLEIVIENQRTTDIVVIANASIAKVSSTFSFAVPIAVSTTEGNYRWALRKATDDTVLMQGPFIVVYAPQGD